MQIEYDNFKKATLLISLQECKNKKTPYVTEIGIAVEWEKKNSGGKVISFELNNYVDMSI